ncbi:hypothetical protein EJ05DRAFT_238998 [Pseudovirgaria hyperparasitica]|uniref:Uncharacterized protein n=1 Tax=Pseudovirgaria hyperparasitica TaxID=470096 RepID=A0A6A6VRP0_9PEZI|nr:uncharacterized protein EJ05DRAFT_238998 [Pseudovirgaria hyperparasitica]KAF2752825.1 hypothetical protein EJ05DRAFT_238998 [Pseudovirgaria hyperparasitica]
MLSTHHNQENRIHDYQAAAAAKSLDQSVKGLRAGTPKIKAPKTPFKVPFYDENVIRKDGKSALRTNGRGNENLLFTSKKGGLLGKDAFVTPAGPRNRAPLGMKTTNAKAQAFQTPAPLTIDPKATNKTQQKSKSQRLRRSKVKVLHSEEESLLVGEDDDDNDDDDDDESEYMPPKEKPLPDLRENFSPDLNLDMLKCDYPTRGMYSHYFNAVDENGYPKAWHDGEIEAAEYAGKAGEIIARGCEDTFAEVDEIVNELRLEMGIQPGSSTIKGNTSTNAKKTKVAPKNEQTRASTKPPSATAIAARIAASALSQQKTKPGVLYSVSTTARESATRKPALSAIKQATIHNLATAASRNTMGYSSGRAVASDIRISSTQTQLRSKAGSASSTNKFAHAHSSSQTTIAPVRHHGSNYTNENSNAEQKERFKPFTYAEETKWLENMDNKALGCTENGEDLEECMRGHFPDSLLLGNDDFEEFHIEVADF